MRPFRSFFYIFAVSLGVMFVFVSPAQAAGDYEYEKAKSSFENGDVSEAAAAEEGYPSAQYGLAELYRLGEGVERSYEESHVWYRRAALQADAEAQNSLGVTFEYGRGIKYNYATARMWYEIAGMNGSKRGERNAKRLERKMNSAMLEKSKKMTFRCINSNYNNCS